MKKIFLVAFFSSMLMQDARAQDKKGIEPVKVVEFKVGDGIGRLRAVPVQLKTQSAILLVYSEDEAIDPSPQMFFFPAHTLKLLLVTHRDTKEARWRYGHPFYKKKPETDRNGLQSDESRRSVVFQFVHDICFER
jgi:hypothetical protein